ncbi:MAG: S24 family peptidase [Rhodospirillales bacterium]
MEPVYRDGDVIIVSPAAEIRRNDRVVLKTQEGEVMAKILRRKTSYKYELSSPNTSTPTAGSSPKTSSGSPASSGPASSCRAPGTLIRSLTLHFPRGFGVFPSPAPGEEGAAAAGGGGG